MSTIQNLYNDFKTLCKQWFYEKDEVDTALSNKQATLISGSNIKTVNNNSLLGSGNITIQGSGGGSIDDYYFDDTTKSVVLDFTNPVSVADIVTSWESTPSDAKVPSEKLVKNYIDEQIGTAIQYIQQ